MDGLMADDILKEAREAFGRCEEAELTNRREALEDLEFARLSKQWPDNIKAQRDREMRPCLTINKLVPVIRQVVNDARQNRPSIAVHPVDSKADPETAEVLTGLIRNIEQSSNADVAYDTAVDSAVTMGFGYWRVNLDYSYGGIAEDDYAQMGSAAFEKDICIRRIANPFSVYGDPWSTEADSSDWNLSFVVERLKKADFKRKYKGAKATDFEGAEWAQCGSPWNVGDEVQVAEWWKREEAIKQVIGVQSDDGVVIMLLDEFEKRREADMLEAITDPRPIKSYKVTQRIISGVEELEKNEWPGIYIPIIPVYGDEINSQGKRFFRSLIRDAKDAQRMFNYWRTTTTEMVALAPRAPYIGRKGSFKSDSGKWATANSASHAYIEFDGDLKPERQPFEGAPAGALQEALNASDDIKAITGIYDASLGAKSNETSGRAIMARQREGDVSTFNFIDNLTRAIRHTGRVVIDLVPKVYSTERVIRILGEDGTPDTVHINADQPQQQSDEAKAALRIHDVRVGRYDVTVKSGPSFTSRREEAATQMIELIRAYPDAAPILGDLLAKNLDWPGADEIAKRLEAMLPPEARGEEGQPDPAMQQQIAQMSEAIAVLGQKLKEAESKERIDLQKLAIEAYKAETERMQVVRDIVQPPELPEGEGQGQPTGGSPELEAQAA